MVAATAKGQFMTWYQHFGGSQLLGELQSNALLLYNLHSQISGKQVQDWGPQRIVRRWFAWISATILQKMQIYDNKRAYIHFSNSFQRESKEVRIFEMSNIWHQRCIRASLALNKVSSEDDNCLFSVIQHVGTVLHTLTWSLIIPWLLRVRWQVVFQTSLAKPHHL